MNPTDSKSITYEAVSEQRVGTVTVLKVGAFAAVSALVAGFAAAWYYRETLQKLKNPSKSENNLNPNLLNPGEPGSKEGLFGAAESEVPSPDDWI